jgi:hypothetical protein
VNEWDQILAAIESNENVNPSYNNPGGIQYGPFAQSQGATGWVPASGGGTIATFPDYRTGYNAAAELLTGYANQGLTLGQVVAKWTGGNGSSGYNNSVVGAGGGDPSVSLSSLGGLGSGGASSALSGEAGAMAGDPGAGSSWVTRGAAIAAGLILIGGGIVLFRPAQEIVTAAARTAGAAARAVTV